MFDNSRRFYKKRVILFNSIKLQDIFVISLDKSHQSRYEPLLHRIKEKGVTYTVTKIPAIAGETITDNPSKLTANTWGCTLSHIKALEVAKERKLPCVLILEDDVDFVPNFTEKLNILMGLLPQDWDAVWLGGVNAVSMDNATTDFYKVRGSWGAFAYIVKSQLYDRWIEGLKKTKLATDDYYKQNHKIINCYRPKTTLVAHLNGWSDRKEQDFHSTRLGL